MKKPDVIAALHAGMARAVRDFHLWTGGDSIRDWGVESLLTVTCAQSLADRIDEIGPETAITLEQSFGGIEEFSGRFPGKGRPPASAARMAGKPTGRVDLVLWNKGNSPRAIIEIKRRDTKAGLVNDAERVMDFVEAAGKAYGGSVRYGIVATVLQSAAARPFEHFVAKANRRLTALQKVAKKAGMVVHASGPKPIADPNAENGCQAASVVFTFTPKPT